MDTRRSSTGFTLVEILVSIVIIALIAAILFPVTFHMKEQSRGTKCLSNLRQLGQATLLYIQDNGYAPPWRNVSPGPDWWATSDSNSGYAAPDRLYFALDPYLKGSKARFCPDDPYAGKNVEHWFVNHRYFSYRFHFRSNLSVSDQGCVLGKILIPASRFSFACDPYNPFPLKRMPDGPHQGGINKVYLDGHAAWSPWPQDF